MHRNKSIYLNSTVNNIYSVLKADDKGSIRKRQIALVII